MSIVCGHRGACGYAPENTFAAFKLALEQGAKWIEFDVQLSRDGVPVILHDDTLERTTDRGGPRAPAELSLSELKELDAGSWFSQDYAGERIPTLDEVLEEFGDKLGLNIEIKAMTNQNDESGIERLVADAVKRHNLYGSVVVSSFNPFVLAKLHAYDPEIKIGALYYEGSAKWFPPGFDFFQLAPVTGAKVLHPRYTLIDEEYMERARREGLEVNTWTVNEPEDMRRMAALGVNLIITNYPDRLVEALKA